MVNYLQTFFLNFFLKKTITFIFLLLINCFIHGQTYTGIVLNSEKQPIAFANVIVQNNEGTLITGTITDEKGEFEILIKEVNYPLTIEISFIGYQNWKKEFISIANYDLGTITLLEDINELETVTLSVKKPTIKRKVDRLIFNVKNSTISSGGDALDILKKLQE